MKCAGCGRNDKALFRTNAKSIPGIFKCRSCIDGHPRMAGSLDHELLDAIDPSRLGDIPEHD